MADVVWDGKTFEQVGGVGGIVGVGVKACVYERRGHRGVVGNVFRSVKRENQEALGTWQSGFFENRWWCGVSEIHGVQV